MGFDIDRSDFWEKGFVQARDLMDQLKRIV